MCSSRQGKQRRSVRPWPEAAAAAAAEQHAAAAYAAVKDKEAAAAAALAEVEGIRHGVVDNKHSIQDRSMT